MGVLVGKDAFGGGVTGRFGVNWEYKSGGGPALFLGGESKFRSTEDEDIGGDPVDDDG